MSAQNADPNVMAIAELLASALQTTGNKKATNQNNIALRRKDVTYSATTQYGHGPSGVFNVPGVNRDLWMVTPRPLGISSYLPMVSTQYMYERFELVMPVTAGTGSEPANDCAPGPNPGKATVGFQNFPFGKVIRTTEAVDVNRLGQLNNNAEPIDLRIVNQMADSSPWIPDPARNANFINSELGLKYFTLGMEFERVAEADMFTGNHANNSPATLGRLYPDGLDILINTGKIDAVYGSPLTGLDSLLINWNNGFYNGNVSLNGQSVDIVTTISATMNYLIARARLTASLPAQWAIAMRYDLFYALTALWPCSYLTNGCTTTGTNLIAVNGAEQVAMRDEMRQPGNEFLWVNGVKYPVWISDQITESTTSGRRVSGIYIIPISAVGKVVTYNEFFDFNNGQISEWDNAVGPNRRRWTSNNGLYYWTFDQTQYCDTVTAKTQYRLIMRRTDLAARIQNVGYNAVVPTNTSGPSDLYKIASGVTSGQNPANGIYVGD